ncbi:hypothetical protein [Prevotella denticola]|uniref:hypothetical protein n=1 Tax=Prevotella denticola TaxID=28129 RepID=UPI001C5FF6AB|nr:hypothetical protein [Prevotella denticola]MBW4758471.1 hypothetical protein [Prevotella denticola]
MKRQGQALTLKNLTKSNVWDIQENDVFRLWAQAERDADLRDNERHYIDVIKSAFTIEEIKIDKPEVIRKYEARGCQVGKVRLDEGTTVKWALKKKPIQRVTDLTWENIHHVSARKLVDVLERNFGGGWESLPQSIQDIIQSGFDISTTTLPTARLKKPGGLYDKKVADGFEVLEISKGSWTEAIFVKEKPVEGSTHTRFATPDELEEKGKQLDSMDNDEEELPEEDQKNPDDEEEEDSFDEDKLTEESYRTTFDTNPEDLEMQAAEVGDDDEF